MKISIAADHAGFAQKQELARYLRNSGFEIVDRGPSDDSRVDYPDFACPVSEDVQKGIADFGVLICGTGIGMSMTANKFSGIRAANITSPEFAALSRLHNNANIICLSGRFVSVEDNKKILDEFFATEFEGGRHTLRVEKINRL